MNNFLHTYKSMPLSHSNTKKSCTDTHSPQKILVAGASGNIGTALVDFLRGQEYEVFCLVRTKKALGKYDIFWDPYREIIELQQMEGFDAVVSFNGVDIAGGRWTFRRKKQILDSRIIPTKFLVDKLAALSSPPGVWLSASAVGYYGGFQGEKSHAVIDETGPFGAGFLAHVCREWEGACLCAQKAGIRVVNMRTGVVLTGKGGILARMAFPFQMGLGAVLSSGEQYMSWISMEDMIRAILHCIQTPCLEGPVNMTAPNPVTNMEFSRALAKVYGKGLFFNIPSPLISLVWGQMGREMLLQGLRAMPCRLQETGFSFLYPDLSSALHNALGR